MTRENLLGAYLIALVGLLCLMNCTMGAERPTIVVFDFTVGETATGNITVQSDPGGSRTSIRSEYKTDLLTDKLITALVQSKKVSVVERKKLDTIMQEMDLTKAELTDPNKSAKVGKLLAADYLLHGSLSMLDGNITYETLPYNLGQQRITEFLVGADIRIVHTETGKIIVAKSEKVKSIKRETNPSDRGSNISVAFQHEIYDELVRRLTARVIDTLFPIKVAYFSEGIAYLNRPNLEEGLQYEVVSLGEVIKDPDTGEILGQAETKIAIVKVVRGMEKVSTAEVVQWFTSAKSIPQGALCRVILPGEGESVKKQQPTKSFR